MELGQLQVLKRLGFHCSQESLQNPPAFLVRPAADPTELNVSDIQWSDGAPIYLQLKERVIAMMLDGILKPGGALPSVRQMAADYQLNTITVSRAYQELAHEGLVEKRRGLGMFMTEQAGTQLRNSERDRFLDEEWTAVLERIQRLGLGLDDLLPRGKSDEYDEGPSSDVIPVPPQR